MENRESLGPFQEKDISQMKTTRMEFSLLSQEEEMPYWSWEQDFRTDCNISSVMNPYCKVATSIGMMP